MLIVPFVELCAPGQPSPYDAFPYVALAVTLLAAAAAAVQVHRHPGTGAAELPGTP